MTEIEQATEAGSIFSGKAPPLLFEITSAHIAEHDGAEKKYVLYTLQIRHMSGRDDSTPAVIERRYTDFSNLFTVLKKDHPQLMASIIFPKKVLTGNFDSKLISTRSTGFESLLKHISNESKLRTSTALLSFLQDVEMIKARAYLAEKQFSYAVPLLENNFRLLSKVYTDRSPAVLLALCRLLGCCISMPGSPNAEKWADITLHRYEGVSDSDLLELYLPLLNVCKKVWWQVGRNTEGLERRIDDLKRQGIRVNESISLLDAVSSVENKVSTGY